jgi:hypothetical protein
MFAKFERTVATHGHSTSSGVGSQYPSDNAISLLGFFSSLNFPFGGFSSKKLVSTIKFAVEKCVTSVGHMIAIRK